MTPGRRALPDDATRLVRARLRALRDGDRPRLSTAEKIRLADFSIWPLVLLALVFVPAHWHDRSTARIAGFGFSAALSTVRTCQDRAHHRARVVWRPISTADAHLQTRNHFARRLIIALVLGLIFVEPDRGTTILLATVSGAMLLIAGVRWKYILLPRCAGRRRPGGFHSVHDPMRMKRIFAGCIRNSTRTARLSGATRP